MNRLLSYRAQTSRTDVAGERASIEQGIGRAEINRRALATDHLLAELGHRTRRGGVIAIGAQLARLAIQFVTLAILARLLLPADFGIIAMAATITGFVVMFSELGLSAATVQRQDIDQDTVSGLFLINAAMGVAVMVAVIALAPVAAWFFEDDRVRTVVIAMALPIPLLAASRQHAALLQRGMRWISLEIATIVAQAIAALVAIAIAWQTDLGYWALVAQSWAAGGLTFALLWLACPWRPSRVRDWSQIRSALGFGLHLTGFQFLNFFHRQFDDVLVGRRWGAVELGYYNRAYLLLLLPLQLINGPVGSVIVPALSRIKDDHRAWARLYRGALQTTIFFTAPMAGLLTLMSPQIVHLALGPEWGESSRIFQILAISILFQPVMSSTGWLWVSAGATRTMLKWAAFSIPLMVLGMIIGLPYGAVGVAAGYAVSIALLTPLCTYYASRGLPIGFLSIYRAIAVPIVAAVIAFAATRWAMAAFGEGTLGMIERVGMFGAIYLLLTYLGEAAIFTRVIEIMKSLVTSPATKVSPGQ